MAERPTHLQIRVDGRQAVAVADPERGDQAERERIGQFAVLAVELDAPQPELVRQGRDLPQR